MAEQNAGLMKIGFVLDVARKDVRFLNDLDRSPFQTLMESGIDLSPGEIQAVIDVVKDTSLSHYAPALKKNRVLWQDILKEAAIDLDNLRKKPTKGK
ncbi:hypothetical protein O4H49_07180 [Kiloniella laminariae]|uniref:Uncharacterized protein n=1 Tax=Kiloniella laminariae TaxID=454162 RepID=A0ABT4LHI4_9PROT|nr:hypothetical protein [Kiloniella laminariae]MCZ4280554.1 hypothetical protein [Kiloniella laminariae]